MNETLQTTETGLETTRPNRPLTTREQLVKIPNVPCLYRHKATDVYYAIKKLAGKIKTHSLETSDRAIADRRLKEWLANLEQLDCEAERTTFGQLLAKFAQTRAGLAPKTVQTETWLANTLKGSWEHGLDIRVSKIRPSMLDTWLAKHEPYLRNSSYNRHTLFLKQIFELAVNDKMIVETENPYNKIRLPWKEPKKTAKKRIVPTEEQFEAIVKSIREEKQNIHCIESANFIEFMGRAGLGQAEVGPITWAQIHLNDGKMEAFRAKTRTWFDLPIYPKLKPLLERMYAAAHKDGQAPSPDAKLFSICDARKSLTNACKRLGFPHFTQRSIRAFLIKTLWRAGIDKKLIAMWQGHQDGGKLILNTYTEVFGADDGEYMASELAKLG